MTSRREICSSPTCHRCTLVFGRCWNHSNLNRATHAHLDRVFNGIHMDFLSHLTNMGSTSPYHVRSNESDNFKDLVEAEGAIEKLRGLKMLFVSGGDNVVWDPASTNESFGYLRGVFGEKGLERFVARGYGHLDTWMAKSSWRDVYPRVEQHVRMCMVEEKEEVGRPEGSSWFGVWNRK